MEELKSRLKYLRLPSRKVRLLADVMRGLPVQEAEAKLMLSPRRPKDALLKLLHSGVSNAKNNHKLAAEKLFVKEVRVDNGPKTKRWTPRSRGSASPIEKRTSHVTLVLGVLESPKVPRFSIERKKKTPKEGRKAPLAGQQAKKEKPAEEKKPAAERPKEAKSEVKAAAKPGAFKKLFQRKSI